MSKYTFTTMPSRHSRIGSAQRRWRQTSALSVSNTRASRRASRAATRSARIAWSVVELRQKGVSETCPLCRAQLPICPEKLYELAEQVRTKLMRAAERPDHSWGPLSVSEQGKMDGATVMVQEAMDQVSALECSMVQRA